MGNKVLNFFLWFFGGTLLLSSLLNINKPYFIFLLIFSISLLPVVHRFLKERLSSMGKENMYKPMLYSVSLISLFVALSGSPSTNKLNSTSTLVQDDYSKFYLEEVSKSNPNKTYSTLSTDNGTYVGEVSNGLKHGLGKFTWKDGTVYDGTFSNDVINGSGTITYYDGEVYRGSFINGKREGNGIYEFNNGDEYTGNWSNDAFSGQGTYTFANGDKYVGRFENNMFNGEGTYTLNGTDYKGKWENNQYKG